MLEREPSRTAFAAAAHRAVHQVLEEGRIFSDPLALAILGMDRTAVDREAELDRGRSAMRLFIAARSRFAETRLREGVERRGVRQLVVLGAGLDTFAYRNPFDDLRVFEADHPATQAWKRRRLAESGVPVPERMGFVPVDFERERLVERLIAGGLDPAQRTFFMWLGVVPYLAEETVFATLAAIAALEGGGEVAFDYADPPETLSPLQRARHRERAARVAALGEPWISYFEARTLHPRLAALGFAAIEDLGPRDLARRHGLGHADAVPERGGHVALAATA